MDINFTQARHVQQMFDWYVHEHLSVSEICQRLEAMSIPSPSGQIKWTVTTVSRMLRNPHYKGCASFGKWRNGQKIERPRAIRNASLHPKEHSIYRTPSEDWIVVPVAPIVDEDLFEAAQEKLEQNRVRFRQRKKGPSHLLQGLVVCGLCGYAYVHSAKTSNHQLYEYYQCSPSRKVDGEKPWCPNPSIRAQELEEAVWVEVCRLLKNPQNLQQEYQRRLHASDGDPSAQTRKHLESQMRKMNKGIERIIDAYGEGFINKDELQPRLRTMRERVKSLDDQLKQLKDQETLESELKLVIGRVEEFAAKVTERLDTLDFLEKREVIRTLVKRVEIYEDKVKVVFKVGNSPLVSRTQTDLENSSHCCEHVSFINFPGVVRSIQMGSNAFVQFRSIDLNPSVNRRMVYLNPSLKHHFF